MVESTRFLLLVACLVSLGQFAVATYLPAFAAIAADLGASAAQVQQSLTAYLLPFALALLGHGAIADACGRRRYVLLGLALFVLGSALCALASNIHWLYLGRALQGLAAGVGIVVGRAMVRDRFDGEQAQRQLALVAMLFCLAPALAPLCGGWLLPFAGWRGVFVFLTVLGVLLLAGCWRYLAETLPPQRRQSLRPRALTVGYLELLHDGRFLLICLANAGVNMAIYLYVLAAPAFVVRHLGLGEQSFAWLFLPLVAGLLLGALAAHRLVGRVTLGHGVLLGHAVMLPAALLNIGLVLWLPLALPWAVLALPLFGLGLMLTQPGLQLLAMDCFAQRRGLASSAFVTLQQLGNALSAALLVPLLLDSPLYLALGMAGLQVLGLLAFVLVLRGGTRPLAAGSA
ncbi:multidrug effflux MFS transporter [Pseudomonas sp. GOM6]|uniref:multidrug effflux MFS transporter n=1 Tax=Pseudomonas sp. GOM6 TaxID=3036944 RepID=UPI0024090C5A|nr:multidrug effflux MFS transporter [Pseudomonas sp. GOM6]MDG1580405.1 multidrug effflux MFS transporter [Pseudomonas sp. GOM6]